MCHSIACNYSCHAQAFNPLFFHCLAVRNRKYTRAGSLKSRGIRLGSGKAGRSVIRQLSRKVRFTEEADDTQTATSNSSIKVSSPYAKGLKPSRPSQPSGNHSRITSSSDGASGALRPTPPPAASAPGPPANSSNAADNNAGSETSTALQPTVQVGQADTPDWDGQCCPRFPAPAQAPPAAAGLGSTVGTTVSAAANGTGSSTSTAGVSASKAESMMQLYLQLSDASDSDADKGPEEMSPTKKVGEDPMFVAQRHGSLVIVLHHEAALSYQHKWSHMHCKPMQVTPGTTVGNLSTNYPALALLKAELLCYLLQSIAAQHAWLILPRFTPFCHR